ncbi:hypothetical protein [Ideonella dechloratans]|nr:hypothetical protein [Ideonella dechloratans]
MPDAMSPPCRSVPLWTPCLLGLLLTLAGCDSLPPPPAGTPVTEPPPATTAAPACEPPATAPTHSDRDLAGRRLLQWQDELRNASGEPLPARIARLSADTPTPAHLVELGLALLHTRNPGDAARAQGLLEAVGKASGDEAAAWAPWARLLAGRAAEQRRLEEQSDRLAQQLRDSQRRIDQLSEKLEALKAIERSLGPKRP